MFCHLARELSYRWSYTFCLCRPVWSPLATWGHVNLSLIKWDKIKNWVSWLCLPHLKRLIATRQLTATVLDGVEGTISNIPEGSFWQRVIRSGWSWLARRSLLSSGKKVINSHCIGAPKSYQIRPTDFFGQRLFSAVQHEQCHSPKLSNMPGSQTPISEVFSTQNSSCPFTFPNQRPLFLAGKRQCFHRREGGALCCSAQELHGSCSLNTRHKEHGQVLFPGSKD